MERRQATDLPFSFILFFFVEKNKTEREKELYKSIHAKNKTVKLFR
jgi:hypothetical protein